MVEDLRLHSTSCDAVAHSPVRVPCGSQGLEFRSGGKEGRVVGPRRLGGVIRGLCAVLRPEALARGRRFSSGDEVHVSESATMASESGRLVGGGGGVGVGYTCTRGDGFGVGGPHAVEGERGDHGGDSALLLGAGPLSSRRAEPGSPASRELPQIERCPALDRVLASGMRLDARVGAVRVCTRGSSRGGGGGGGGGGGEDGRDGGFLGSGGTLYGSVR